MARDVAIRYTLKGELACCTPLHVGGFGTSPDTDLPLARDGQDHCYIPGTSLAGALRQWCETAFSEGDVNKVWGFQNDDDGTASHITIDNLQLDEKKLIPEIRDGVGIDRKTGAAADGIKYDRQIIPRGTVLTGFTVTAEVGDEQKSMALAMLAGLQQALEQGRIRLGASKTRGLGKVKLNKGKLREVSLKADGIFHLLRGTDSELTTDISALQKPKESPRLDITINWEPNGPLMVKAGFDGIAVDMLPLVSGVAGGVSPVLPGSSIKGALRSRAERIVRTMRPDVPDAISDFLKDTDVPLVNELFGARGGVDEALGLGALAVDDCYAEKSFQPDEWNSIIGATNEQDLRDNLDRTPAKDWQQAFHVAIDRWTGGAAESMLYTVLEPHGATWDAIALSVEFKRTSLAGVALLLLALRDMERGRLPLGFGVNRGLGAVKIESITIEPHEVPGIEKSFDLSSVPPAINDAWKAWCK